MMRNETSLDRLRDVRFPLLWAGFSLLLAACGPKHPPRYVLEHDVDGYRYRRYQQVLDVEFPFEGNPAVGHTATYVRGGAQVRVAPVVVTQYEQPAALTDSVRQRLRAMDGYTLDVVKEAGDYVWRMRGGAGDQWLLWVSDRYLVKLGAPEGEGEVVPHELAEAYLDLYPSDLDDKGKAKPGRSSAGAGVGADAGTPSAGGEAVDAE
jgi:hypothetical protein